MIKPKPYKFICPKCKYKKIVNPKSDVMNPKDINSTCPKCSSRMNKKDLSMMDEVFRILTKR